MGNGLKIVLKQSSHGTSSSIIIIRVVVVVGVAFAPEVTVFIVGP